MRAIPFSLLVIVSVPALAVVQSTIQADQEEVVQTLKRNRLPSPAGQRYRASNPALCHTDVHIPIPAETRDGQVQPTGTDSIGLDWKKIPNVQAKGRYVMIPMHGKETPLFGGSAADAERLAATMRRLIAACGGNTDTPVASTTTRQPRFFRCDWLSEERPDVPWFSATYKFIGDKAYWSLSDDRGFSTMDGECDSPSRASGAAACRVSVDPKRFAYTGAQVVIVIDRTNGSAALTQNFDRDGWAMRRTGICRDVTDEELKSRKR